MSKCRGVNPSEFRGISRLCGKWRSSSQHPTPALANAEVGVELLNFTVTTASVVSVRINSSESREKRRSVPQSRYVCVYARVGAMYLYIVFACETRDCIVLVRLNKKGFSEIFLHFFEAFLLRRSRWASERRGRRWPRQILSGSRGTRSLPGTAAGASPGGTGGPGEAELGTSHTAEGGRNLGPVFSLFAKPL